MNDWISVEDKLPKPLEDVLCYYQNGKITIAEMFFEEGRFSLESYHGKVLYWMPLPESPKMKGCVE